MVRSNPLHVSLKQKVSGCQPLKQSFLNDVKHSQNVKHNDKEKNWCVCNFHQSNKCTWVKKSNSSINVQQKTATAPLEFFSTPQRSRFVFFYLFFLPFVYILLNVCTLLFFSFSVLEIIC